MKQIHGRTELMLWVKSIVQAFTKFSNETRKNELGQKTVMWTLYTEIT